MLYLCLIVEDSELHQITSLAWLVTWKIVPDFLLLYWMVPVVMDIDSMVDIFRWEAFRVLCGVILLTFTGKLTFLSVSYTIQLIN